MFDIAIHADWSTDPRKRWMARAVRSSSGWRIAHAEPCKTPLSVIDAVRREGRSLLFGADFPIGVPAHFGRKSGLETFLDALKQFGRGEWRDVYEVCDRADEVSLHRPFFPRVSRRGVTRQMLVQALEADNFDVLLRRCERRTAESREACSLFWTLGGNQVGKAAISGWRDLVVPAKKGGAAIWPFDGDLTTARRRSAIVIAETYPAAAYHLVNASFQNRESKRRQSDRREKGLRALSWASARAISFEAEAERQLRDGFGGGATGEDAFDAMFGLFKMIAVVDGERPERSSGPEADDRWEGWILGR